MERGDKMEIEPVTESASISFEEDEMIPEGYQLVPLDGTLQEEEFSRGIARRIENDIKPFSTSSYEDPEQVSEYPNGTVKLADDTNKDESDDEIEEVFIAVMERIKAEEMSDVKPPLVSRPAIYDALCRLCATPGNDMVDIFGANETRETIAEKIENCLPVVVRRTDNLTKQACRSCLDKLEFCYEFYRSVAVAEKQLITLGERTSGAIGTTEKHCENSRPSNNEGRITDSENIEATTEAVGENIDCLSKELSRIEDKGTTDSLSIGNEKRKSERQTVDRDTIECRICKSSFQTVKKCHIHSSIHASEDYYPCGICDNAFTTEKECNEHNLEHTESKKKARRVCSHVCDECGKKFMSEARLEFHKNYHNSDDKPCYCDRCDKTMASETSLYKHMMYVHRQYKQCCCDICGKQFRTQGELTAHQRKHKDERPFECNICSKRFYTRDILTRHKKLHLPDKPYQCDQCGKRFDRHNTLTKHLIKHQAEAGTSVNCQVCNNCNEVFADIQTANNHLKNCSITSKTRRPKTLVLNLKEIYRCEYCQKCYTDIASVKNHRVSHSDPSPYICTVCNTRYSSYSQVTSHRMCHKKSSKLVKTVEDNLIISKYFACEYCDKKYLHFTNMNMHRRTCLKRKVWTCGCCGSLFASARELSKHKRGGTTDKKWPCNDCNFSFGSECALKIHKEAHSRFLRTKKSYSCSHCGKTFTQKSHLTIHVRSHTGERPYNCDLCEKSYKIKSERDNHRRTHSGEKPFKCSVCEKSFANTARLREHTRFHSGNRPYNCPQCDQSYKTANARNVHMTIHTGEKPYQCDVCGTYFRISGDMRKHKRTKHGDKFKTDNKSNTERRGDRKT